MPKIPKEHLDSIATIFAKKDYVAKPAGTAFLLSYKDDFASDETVYLITCFHCGKDEATKIVFKTGETIPFDKGAWKADPAGNDVIARDVTDLLPDEIKKCNFPTLSNHVRNFPSHSRNSEVGDEIYMLGLHVPEAPEKAITPRARFGNISAWASENELVEQGHEQRLPSHIGDMRSRPGFSGSPVFTITDTLDWNDSPSPTLLGVHSAQFAENITVRSNGENWPAWAPSSMTVIVPAWVLSFIVEDREFRALRDQRLWNLNESVVK
ncbi:UNVERIFIED_ORG: hypothetical protein J2W66_004378 [Agrobacterium larrymoorei]|nr:hypothetical protein [Agrobacterium larrymoorei]